MMRKVLIAFAFAMGLSLTGSVAAGQPAPAAAGSDTARALIRQIDIPFQSFTLANGLRVFVHTDRKAPVVAVSVWYNVGSKDEPRGQTGFAHLFEHLMFYGSENAPGPTFQRMEEMGATDWNGSTWFDRTNYYETVPTAALDTALFIESDRMGHLLGAVTEEKMRNQIQVVQNEKRQGDNEPYGMVEYAELETLFPQGHPYHHSAIGSMADLDASSLQAVQQWFRNRYGPNNAVLVLAGDIDVATARRRVERYFGDIPRGPVNVPAAAGVPTLPARVDQVLNDHVPTTRIQLTWAVPGLGLADNIPLEIGASALGGLASSRLDTILVRGEQLAVRVNASVQTFQRIAFFRITADVRPGVDPDRVARRLEEVVNGFVAQGPTADEVRRVTMQRLAGRIRGLEQVGGEGGKAVTIAEGALYMNDPAFYRRELAAYAAATPRQVQQALHRWLSRPVFALRIVPGERPAYEEGATGRTGTAQSRPRYFHAPDAAAAPAPLQFQPVDRSRVPEPGPVADLRFPAVERATLSNGVRVSFVRRDTVPVVRVALLFDAGFAADTRGREGLQSLMSNLLDEGTAARNSVQIAEQRERLGMVTSIGASVDQTYVQFAALRANLAPSLDLIADLVRNPAFTPADIERLRIQQANQIAAEQSQPQGIALRTLPPLLYGADSPYGVPFTGSGTAASLQAITRDDIVAAHQRWIRPDTLEIFVVGDTTLGEIVPLLEARFGRWQAPAAPRGTKTFRRIQPPAGSRIVLIDRPQSPQSVIMGGMLLPLDGTDDTLALQMANEALGGAVSARIYQDLRERRGWTYGAYSYIREIQHQSPWFVVAPVQANRTGESIAVIQQHLREFLSTRGVTAEELARIISSDVRGLPGSYETSTALLSAISGNALLHRPDDYQSRLASRYRAATATDLDNAARSALRADGVIWVVVGDAATVRPQLDRLGLPIETMTLQ